MTHRFRILPVLVAAASLTAAGCGSSSNNNVASTKAQLIAKADPVCQQVATKRAAANASVQSKSTKNPLSALASVAPAIAADEQQAVDKLNALKAPASLTHDWQEMLKGMQELAKDTKQLSAYAKSNNSTEVERIVSGGRQIRASLTTIATRDGFKYCGRTS